MNRSVPIMAKTRATHMEIIKAAVGLASKRSFDHLLYVGDLPLPEEVFRGKSGARKKLVQAVVSEAQRAVVEDSGVPVIHQESSPDGLTTGMEDADEGALEGLGHVPFTSIRSAIAL